MISSYARVHFKSLAKGGRTGLRLIERELGGSEPSRQEIPDRLRNISQVAL
jgi:hypothetical protein